MIKKKSSFVRRALLSIGLAVGLLLAVALHELWHLTSSKSLSAAKTTSSSRPLPLFLSPDNADADVSRLLDPRHADGTVVAVAGGSTGTIMIKNRLASPQEPPLPPLLVVEEEEASAPAARAPRQQRGRVAQEPPPLLPPLVELEAESLAARAPRRSGGSQNLALNGSSAVGKGQLRLPPSLDSILNPSTNEIVSCC
jgi:hypothetical protein